MTNAPAPAPAPAAVPAPFSRPAGRWYRWRGLPHFEAEGIAQAITFRLHDSIPSELIRTWDAQLAHQAPAVRQRVLHRRIELYLDGSDAPGGNWLARPEIARIACESICHYDRVRYDLHAWVVMPNHAHILCTARPGFRIADIVRTWKSFSGREANRVLGREGPFWHRDYFDRFIRGDEHFARVMAYLAYNPVKARLCREPSHWPWSSAALGRGSA